MLETIRYLAGLKIDGIKLQLLHVLKGTDLDRLYRQSAFQVLELSQYLELVGDCLKLLPPETVIHRLTGDGPRSLLTAPLWSGNKRLVLNSMARYLKENKIYQARSTDTPGPFLAPIMLRSRLRRWRIRWTPRRYR